MTLTKGAHQSAKFQTSDRSRKISPNFTLIGSLKCVKFYLRNTEELYLTILKIDAKSEENSKKN